MFLLQPFLLSIIISRFYLTCFQRLTAHPQGRGAKNVQPCSWILHSTPKTLAIQRQFCLPKIAQRKVFWFFECAKLSSNLDLSRPDKKSCVLAHGTLNKNWRLNSLT